MTVSLKNYTFHIDCWRHANDPNWWAKVSTATWKNWLTQRGWLRVEGRFYSGPGVELWQHTTERDLNARIEDHRGLKTTGAPAESHWADYGRLIYSCAEQALGETSSWHNYVRASRLGDVLFELLSAERAFAACICLVDRPDTASGERSKNIEQSKIWSLTTNDGVSLVGGKLEPRETSFEAALRELLEESGVKFRAHPYYFLYRTLDSESEIVDTLVFDVLRSELSGTFAGNGREGIPGWNLAPSLLSHKRYGEYNRGLIEFVKDKLGGTSEFGGSEFGGAPST